MTHTTEFLRGMFAAYMGCEVQYVDTNNRKIVAKLTGVSVNDGLETTYKRKRKSIAGGYVLGDYLSFKPNGNHNTDALHCKPVLTPLSEITDSDAVEVSKIMTVATNCDWVGAGKNETIRFLHLLIIGNKENNDYDDNMALGSGVVAQIIDYLRSPYRPDGTPKPIYDCGYMHIQSLIQADLAISSKQI